MAKTKTTKRADGRFQKSITDPKTGKRIFFYGASEREINRKILDYTRKIEQGRTFEEVADDWWTEAYEVISPTSVRGYRVAKERALMEFGKMHIRDIKARDISAYLSRLANLGYAKSTVKNYKIVISRIFNHALLAGDIEYSPTIGVEIPRGLRTKRRTSADEADEEIIKNTSDVWIMPYLALMTGLRKGELLALQWADIDFTNKIIKVSKSLYYEGGAHIKSTKTEAGTRIVPLLSPLLSKLLPLKSVPSYYVLSDNGKDPLSSKRFRTLMKHYQEKTGIKATLHQLRKSFATVSVKAGIEPKVLQSIMGHKNITTTYNIYADVRKDSIDAAGVKLDSLLSSKLEK
ncbi:MAG: site-specific integrase [Clostridia bacterium]|nr:site-specific integrase [Clostridia bacterium]